MTGRIVRSTDFERVLRVPPRAKSAHFALHHLLGAPTRFVRKPAASIAADAVVDAPNKRPDGELSTGAVSNSPEPVDDSSVSAPTQVLTPMPMQVSQAQSSEVQAPVQVPQVPQVQLPQAQAVASWLGTVVPKRHARRSVTRSLLKRQMHAAFEREARLPGGLWVLRLRSGFDVKKFPSAASDALRSNVREELDALLANMVRKLHSLERSA